MVKNKSKLIAQTSTFVELPCHINKALPAVDYIKNSL